MKKAIALLLSSALMANLAGCLGSSSTTTTTAAANSGTQAAAESTAADAESTETEAVVDGDYDDVTLKLSYATGDTGMDGLTAIEFERLVEQRSGGKVKIDRYPNCQLSGGDMVRHVEMLLSGGAFELAIISDNSFQDVDSYFYASSCPFTFSSYDDAYAKFDGDAGKLTKQHFADLGVNYFSTFPNGIMQFANNKKEVRSPEDMKNLKMRTYGDMQMSLMRDMGADPTQLSWSELYSALQTGAVDGQMNGYQTMYSGSMYEVQKYITEVNATFAGYDFLANSNSFSKLKPDTQSLIESCAVDAAKWGRDYMKKAEADCKQAMIDYGCEVYVPTADEMQQFKDAAKPTIDGIKEKVGEEACNAWGLND
jgi:tripartite ATP-independent transporter DctP family solute receptor